MTVTDFLAAAILLFVLVYVYGQWNAPGPKFRLPPGPAPLPLVGNVHQVPFEHQQHAFTAWGRKYGPIVYAKFLSTRTIILNSVQVAEDLLERKGAIYSDRPTSIVVSDMLAYKPIMVFLPYAEEWRLQRKWFQTIFKSLDEYRPVQQRESLKLLKDIIEAPHAFIPHIKRYPSALMMEIAYGRPVSTADDEFVNLANRALKELVELGSLASTVIDFIPPLQHIPTWMPGAGFKRRAIKAHGLIQAMMGIPYEQVKEDMASGSAKSSFLKTLLEDHSQNGSPAPEEEFQMKGASSVMFAAGSDTTISVLQSFVLAMVLYPQVFRKAQEEIDRVIGSARLPDLDDKDSLPYLECVIKEIYRWATPVPLGVPHRVMEDDEYNGYHIPKGCMVISNISAMTRDPDMYFDPESFLPERFEEMDPEEAELKDPRRMIFGFGRRICPGRHLADGSVWLAAARMIATLNIRKACDLNGVEITPEPVFVSGAVSHPKPFVCDIRPRSDKVVDMIEQLYASITA